MKKTLINFYTFQYSLNQFKLNEMKKIYALLGIKMRNKHASSIHFKNINFVSEAEFELSIYELQFAIHFNNFREHFFLIFAKFMNQFLITKFN